MRLTLALLLFLWLYDGLYLYALALWNEHKLDSEAYQQTMQRFENYDDVLLYSDKQTAASNINNLSNASFKKCLCFPYATRNFR